MPFCRERLNKTNAVKFFTKVFRGAWKVSRINFVSIREPVLFARIFLEIYPCVGTRAAFLRFIEQSIKTKMREDDSLMKKVLLITASVLILIILSACVYDLDNAQGVAVAPPSTLEALVHSGGAGDANGPHAYWQGLHMVVPEGSVTPTGLRLSMINDSELNFGHGVMFNIEQYSDGQWMQVPFISEVWWILPLLDVAPNTVVDENIGWVHMHGELPPGQYRILRNFMVHDFFDPTPMWQRNIDEAYLYAVFTIETDWQDAHDLWQNAQDNLAATAFVRFDDLDLQILEYSPRGLSFTLANNSPEYSYIITGAFVGWEDTFPEGGFAGAVEYFIFSQGLPNDSWPFGHDMRLHPGEYLTLALDWYDEIGNLTSSMAMRSRSPYIFDLIIDVMLDVDEEYIRENFQHSIPGLPGIGHRISASFDLAE